MFKMHDLISFDVSFLKVTVSIKIMNISIIPQIFLIPNFKSFLLYLCDPISSSFRWPPICFLTLNISLHFVKLYINGIKIESKRVFFLFSFFFLFPFSYPPILLLLLHLLLFLLGMPHFIQNDYFKNSFILLPVSIINSFLLLSSISLHGYVTIYTSIHLVINTCIVSKFGLWTFLYKSLYGNMLLYPVGKCQEF